MPKYNLYYHLDNFDYEAYILNQYMTFIESLRKLLKENPATSKCMVSLSKTDEWTTSRIESYIKKRYVDSTYMMPINVNQAISTLHHNLHEVVIHMDTGDVDVFNAAEFKNISNAFLTCLKDAMDENYISLEDGFSPTGVYNDKFFAYFQFNNVLRMDMEVTIPTTMYLVDDDETPITDKDLPKDYTTSIELALSLNLNNFKTV